MKPSAINYFELKSVVERIGLRQPHSHDFHNKAYHLMKKSLERYGRLVVIDYPKLRNHIETIGYTKISKKMIENYKD